jgi:hypothetical protein
VILQMTAYNGKSELPFAAAVRCLPVVPPLTHSTPGTYPHTILLLDRSLKVSGTTPSLSPQLTRSVYSLSPLPSLQPTHR